MKKLFRNETGRLHLLLALLLIIAAAIFVLLNVLVSSLSERLPLSADLTANAAYDLGSDTREILENLDSDVHLYVLADTGSFQGNAYLLQMRTLLDKYPRYSDHITLEYVDYMTDPSFAARYPQLSLSAGDVLADGPAAVKQIPLADMFLYSYDAEGNLTVSGSRVEEAVTSAVLGAVTSDPVRVGILTGSAVSEERQVLSSLLSSNQFAVEEINLAAGSFSDQEVLILLAPAQDLSEEVLSRLDAFLQNGGAYGKTLLYAASAKQPELSNLNVFLREWGITVDDGAVFETDENMAYGYQPYYPFVTYTDETFRDLLKDSQVPVLMPIARPLSVVYTFKDSRTVTELLSFSASAGVRPSDAGSNFSIDQSVRNGPFPAALLSTLTAPGSTEYSNVIVFASSEAFSDAMLSNPSIANAEYLVGMLNRISDRGDAVSIQAKSLAGNALTMTTTAARTFGVILCIVIPLLVLFAGIGIYLRRRYR